MQDGGWLWAGRDFFLLRSSFFLCITVYHGMSDELHVEIGNAGGIPFFFKRKDAEQQIKVFGHLARATGPRGPHLRRNVLNDLRVPIVERAAPRSNVFLDGVGKAAIEAGEIHTDDGVWLAVGGDFEKLIEAPLEFAIIRQYLPK